MARAGMALRRGGNQGNTDAADDVQRSIELLDRVLSEFDDVENANQVQNIQQISTSTSTPVLRHHPSNSSSTPEDESPSLGGHQSEDDGYMSMNGRKAPRFNAAFRPVAEVPPTAAMSPPPPTLEGRQQLQGDVDDFPPPPEEAQRLIATLLPKVSPGHRSKSIVPPKNANNKNPKNRGVPLTQLPPRMDTIPPPQKFQNTPPIVNGGLATDAIHTATATQTTLPKTRHQRPYGWENNDFTLNPPPPPPGYRFGSLPFQHGLYPLMSPTRVPPRTVPTALERHREVRRHGSEDNLSSDLEEPINSIRRPLSELADDEHFSDDSLEEILPPPPPPVCNKRASIAWEVPLDDDALLTPGSTKVIGRRRRKSGSHSSTSSIPNRLKDLEDWPDPPPCTTEDEVMSPFSDSDDHVTLPAELNSGSLSGTGTYIIRRGGKKDRKSLVTSSVTSNSSLNSRLSSDLSIPASSRFSSDINRDINSRLSREELNSRLSRELNTPNSRYSIDLSTPHSRLSQELTSPKSRFSLDLNNSRHYNHHFSHELLASSPSRLSTDLSSSRSSTPSKLPTTPSKHQGTPSRLEGTASRLEGTASRLEGTANNRSEQNTPNGRFESTLTCRLVQSTPNSRLETTQSRYSGVDGPGNKTHSTTFDNIQSLIREGVIVDYDGEGMEDECVEDMVVGGGVSPIVRVVSLPSLNAEDLMPRRELDVTVEEEEDAESSQPSAEISPLRKIEQNISELLERRDIEVIQDDKFMLNGVEILNNKDKKERRKAPSKPSRDGKSERKSHDLQKSSSHNEIQKSEDYYRQLLMEGNPFPKRNGIQKSESAKEMLIAHRDRLDHHNPVPPLSHHHLHRLPTSTSADFPVRVEVLHHDFPPLPPSPVEEADDEYSEIVNHHMAGPKRADTLPNSEAPAVPPHRGEAMKSRSMDAGYTRGRRSNFYNGSTRSSIPSERRTLPTDLQESKRRPFQKRSSHSPQEERHLQTSCSLPETPIFARGCDIPRTPHRRAPDVPGNQTAPRQSNTIGSLNTVGNMSTGGYRRQLSHSGLEQTFVGADLLRLAGGPNRGWYPKQKGARRPASIEHLDRMAPGHNPWEQQTGRKPCTLPPNLTPKFFQRSPRDALRRVTSLLIRKGNNGKELRKEKEIVSPTIHENVTGEEVHKKKGFFKNLWKRSRHYSLEQQ